ncbi:MAG: radical SAM protein [Clostridia bacterium]|nr:radical SAM protein [Clostridia bacterium]
MLKEYNKCNLCHRECGVNRNDGEIGFCRSSSTMKICRAALHPWEEPIISGTNGSGTIFFSGCSLGCIFCQNNDISRAAVGRPVDESALADIMLDLESQGAHNINLVTPTHFVPSIIKTVAHAREKGLKIPIVYNTGTFDRVETVRSLDGTVDVYLPDYKYYRGETAKRYSNAPAYPTVALDAIREMVRQRPTPILTDGLIKSGVVIRMLLLPGHLAEEKLSLKRLYTEFGNSVYFSLMGQYTPIPGMPAPLNRTVTRSEYDEFICYADTLGVTQAFVQDLSSASTSYIPDFYIE